MSYVGTFIKASGEARKMKFVKVEDLPLDTEGDKKDKKERKLQKGMELVWDLEKQGYRIFNHSTITNPLRQDGLVTVDLSQNSKVSGEKND